MPYRLLSVAHEHPDCYIVVDEHDRRVGGPYSGPLEAAKVCAGLNAAEEKAAKQRRGKKAEPLKAEFAEPEDTDHPPFVDGGDDDGDPD